MQIMNKYSITGQENWIMYNTETGATIDPHRTISKIDTSKFFVMLTANTTIIINFR